MIKSYELEGLVSASDYLSKPDILSGIDRKYIFLVDVSSTLSYSTLLEAIEKAERNGWILVNVTCRSNLNAMYALLKSVAAM